MGTVIQTLSVVAMLLLGGRYAHAEVIGVEGTIKSIDPDARSISLTRQTPKGEKVLELEIAKNAGDMEFLKSGQRLFLTYDPKSEVVSRFRRPLTAREFEKLMRSKSDADGGIVFGFLYALGDASGLVEHPTHSRNKLLKYLESHPEKAEQPAVDVIRDLFRGSSLPE